MRGRGECGADEALFGTMHATVYDPIGLAGAFVHEMAHQKLRALGVSFEASRRLITNSPTQRFESPVRKDKLRPMTAVFHAEYSFTYVTALDIRMIEAEWDEIRRERLLSRLRRNMSRIQEGLGVIRPNIEVDPEGERFLSGFYRWINRVIAHSDKILERSGAMQA